MGFFTRKKKAPPKPGGKPQVPEQPTIPNAIYNRQKPKEDLPTAFWSLEELQEYAGIPQASNTVLDKIKKQVAQLTVIEHGTGMYVDEDTGRYHPLPERILDVTIVKTDAATFIALRTRTQWCVLYDVPHEELHDRNPALMNVDLKLRDISVTPKGKKMYLSSIKKSDLNKLQAIEVMDARKKGKTFADSLMLVEGAPFDYEGTKKRIQRCEKLHSTDLYFDPVVFGAQIQFMTPTQGSSGHYYYIQAGNPNDPKECELHVGTDPKHPQGSYKHKATLIYGNEPCFLYTDVNY